jgi:hypothetical protein|tara:strand:- start:656 stop:862 length:207 start_codon:yes stop_codon:yes gene_type:complete
MSARLMIGAFRLWPEKQQQNGPVTSTEKASQCGAFLVSKRKHTHFQFIWQAPRKTRRSLTLCIGNSFS